MKRASIIKFVSSGQCRAIVQGYGYNFKFYSSHSSVGPLKIYSRDRGSSTSDPEFLTTTRETTTVRKPQNDIKKN